MNMAVPRQPGQLLSPSADMAEDPHWQEPAYMDAWRTNEPAALADLEVVITGFGHAFHAGAVAVERALRDGLTADLAIGAAIHLPGREMYFWSRATDNETGDPEAHAERCGIRAVESARDRGLIDEKDLFGLTLTVTAEPCPDCIDGCNEASKNIGLSRVLYANPRKMLEELGIVKPHGKKAAQIMAEKRAETGEYQFDLSQFPSPAVSTACLELLLPYSRDINTGEVSFAEKELRASRVTNYLTRMNELISTEKRLPDLTEQISDEFHEVLNPIVGNQATVKRY